MHIICIMYIFTYNIIAFIIKNNLWPQYFGNNKIINTYLCIKIHD